MIYFIFVSILCYYCLRYAGARPNTYPTTCQVVVEPPWPTPYLLVPWNSTVLITCITNSNSPFWSIDLRNDGISSSIQFGTRNEELNNNGIFQIESPAIPVNQLQLLVNDTEKNNQTSIACVGDRGEEYLARLFLYKPSALIIEAMDTEAFQSVNVSWSSLPSLVDPEPNQTYTLTVKTSSLGGWTLQLNKPYYLFTAPEGAPSCEVYNFSVSATYVGANYTGDGCSAHSPVISRTLPSLPDIKGLNSTLTYSLIKKAGKVTLNASFESAIRCENYPVNYTLEVNSSSETASRTSTIEQGQYIVIDNLLEDREYSFTVLAANAVGVVSSTKRQFFTTDVQNVEAVFSNYSDNTYMFGVECNFIQGSDAKGCMVVLVENGINITVDLTRDNNTLHASGIINVTFRPVKYCTELAIFGYDIESNGSVGTLSVEGTFMINESIPCIEKEEDMKLSSSSHLPVWSFILIAVAAVITIIILSTVILLGGVIAFFKRSKAREFTPSAQSNGRDSSKLHLFSSQLDRDRLESNQAEEILTLSDISNREKNLAKRTVEDSCPEHAQSNYAEVKDSKEHFHHEVENNEQEHFYHVLENNASKNIKESSQPPIYQDVFDFPMTKVANSTVENQYYTSTA